VPTGSRKFAIVSIASAIAASACANNSVDEPIEQGPRANGAIVFVAGPLPDYYPLQLFSMQPDGTQLRQLTDDMSYKTALATSPDGSRIAYAASDEELTEESPAPEPSSIFVIDADGGGRRELCQACARTAYTFEPELGTFEGDLYDTEIDAVPNSLAWSPGGSTIAVPAITPGVLLIEVETGRTTTIPTPEPVTALAWSPDGTRLALSHTWFIGPPAFGAMVPREGTLLEREPVELAGGIYVLDLRTNQLNEVVSTPGAAHVHGWSYDSDRIAYTRELDPTRAELSAYSMTDDRSWTVVAAERGDVPIGVDWSPSDDAIAALVNGNNEQGNIANTFWLTPSVEVDIRALPLCAFEGAVEGDLCAESTIVWSPDGSMVAYRASVRGPTRSSAVALQGIDGSFTDVVKIDGASFDIGDNPCCLAWLPAP